MAKIVPSVHQTDAGEKASQLRRSKEQTKLLKAIGITSKYHWERSVETILDVLLNFFSKATDRHVEKLLTSALSSPLAPPLLLKTAVYHSSPVIVEAILEPSTIKQSFELLAHKRIVGLASSSLFWATCVFEKTCKLAWKSFTDGLRRH